jgi:gliding motility-associated-like protein
MCNILSGCFCDSSVINPNGLIEINGLDYYWTYSAYEWLTNGSSFVPTQNSGSLVIDPSDPNYLSLISGNISLAVTDIYGCSYESEDLIIDPNCCISAVTNFFTADTICDGDSIVVGSSVYDTTGVYIDSLISSYGCDSIIHTTLVVNNATTSTATQTSCDSYTWNGIVYTASGIYTFPTTNSNGCDSTATLNLTINYSNMGSSAVTACDSYTWDGQTYTTSGAYTKTYTNVSGCDSVHTLNLTITPPLTSIATQTSCDSLTWNGTAYTASGTYTYITNNSAGCDSIATLNLTINTSTSSTNNQTICDGDSIVIGANTYSIAGNYTDTLLNSNGCDSTVTTVLILSTPENVEFDAGKEMDVTIVDCEYIFTGITITPPYYRFLWSTGDTVDHIEDNLNPGSYSVLVTDSIGCQLEASIVIAVIGAACIPNVFTPNGDDKNDVWELGDAFLYADSEIKIYGRFGKKIFESNGYKTPWDGTNKKGRAMPEGVYFYIINLMNGHDPIRGSVTIIR